jgi:hypothetical protein
MPTDGVVMPDAGGGKFYHDGFDPIEPAAVVAALGHSFTSFHSCDI